MRDAHRSPGLRLLFGALGVIVAMTLPRGVAAQLSPGPLARPHASLDVPLGCAKCHGGRKEPTTQKCLACHREIATLKQQERGYHSRGNAATGTCASCHPDHAGREFDLIKWPQGSQAGFDHSEAGWLLEGKHEDVKCEGCHKSSFHAGAIAELSPRTGGPRWAGLDTRCASCHDDPHRPTLGARCTSCHDIAGWKPAPNFDHKRTKYPLTGEHRDVECDACHLAPRLNPRRDPEGKLIPVFKPVPAKECSSCHADPHKAPTMARCSSCHVTTGFRKLKRGAFDHDRTRFPLSGEHRTVACAECHAGYPARINRPSFSTCATCHSDPHRGQATLAGRAVDCAGCHDVNGFSPSTFTVAQHQLTKYPLLGRHRTARCGDCHRAQPTAAGQTARGARVIADLHPSFESCTSCHLDPHVAPPAKQRRSGSGGSVSDDTCESCHTVNGFTPSTLTVASHEAYEFKLEGAHRTVPCAECHRELQRRDPRRQVTLLHEAARRRGLAPLTFEAATSCTSCHQSPHGQQFASRRDRGACESCHSLDVFTPAERFDHDRDSKFPLSPAHTRVPCTSCHGRAKGTGQVQYRGTVVRCEQCHSGGKR
ncbi:MAG TPA: hypothetical protein VFB46_10655 [Gemmatimonadaceae bacterium]|nr:hypothetical protein [Gemmatimonadaceae bacterium]